MVFGFQNLAELVNKLIDRLTEDRQLLTTLVNVIENSGIAHSQDAGNERHSRPPSTIRNLPCPPLMAEGVENEIQRNVATW